MASDSLRPVTLAELVATLSLVADLGMGRPMERVLRQTVVAMRLGAAAGMDRAACSSAYYASLLTWVGCAVDTAEVAELFGDETELYADTRDGDLGGVSLAVFVARHLGRGKSSFHRIGMVGRFLASAGRSVQQVMQAHCQEASDLAGWLELGPTVCEPLLQAFERWDGRGVPGLTGADGLAPAIRLVHLADSIEAFHHAGGAEAALHVARERRGTQFDPALVDCFCVRHAEILDGLGRISAWEEVIALDPRLGAALSDDQLDRALSAFADFSDLKSALRLGHSRAVADLAAQAGTTLGLPAADVVMLRRAALVHSHFAQARARCPVQRACLGDGHPAWVVLGYDAARRALSDPSISKDMLAALQEAGDVVAEGLPGPEFSRHMLNVDPPDHTRLRRLVSRAFVPGRIAALEPAIRAIASSLLDELDAAGPGATVDLIEGYAYPLPFGVIGELLGVPAADRPGLHAWFQVLLTGWAGDPPPEAVAASDGIVTYLGELVDAKRRNPADDLVSVLVAADGDALTTQELLSSLFQLVVAGHDTTASLIGNGVVALLDHPGQLQALLADPGQLPAAIDELIRFTAPVPHATFRMTTEPMTLDGVRIPAHEQVLVCLGSANRDPGRFPAPDVLDIGRGDGPNLGFGHGSHYCLGAPLARLEAKVAFEALLGRYPGLRLAAGRDALAWAHGDGLVLRGLVSLHVVLGPDPAGPSPRRR